MADFFRISTVDRLGKVTSSTLPVASAATGPNLQAIVDAMDAIILGSAIKGVRTVPTVIDAGSAAPPANTSADRLNKWLLRIQDNVNSKIFTYELGTADNSQLPSSTTDFLDLSAGVGLALKTAVETAYESEYGNAGTLLSVQQVNRGGAQ